MFGNKKVKEIFLFSQNIIYFCLKLIYFRITHFDELFVFCNRFWHCVIATPCICTADITSYSKVYLRDIHLNEKRDASLIHSEQEPLSAKL